MNQIQNLVEYYDELYPISDAQKQMYKKFNEKYPMPIRYLRVSCGTGLFESNLSKEGHDVTGIEEYNELLRTANMRRRSQVMSIRFFQMTNGDMIRFLGKSFYNVVSNLNSRLMFCGTEEKFQKFFQDAKLLLAEGGTLVVHSINFDSLRETQMVQLPVKESVRSKLFTEVWTDSSGRKSVTMNIETGSGKMLPLIKDEPVYPVNASSIERCAKEAGFTSVEFYSDFTMKPFNPTEDEIVAVIS